LEDQILFLLVVAHLDLDAISSPYTCSSS
jgi:hypothetical protein